MDIANLPDKKRCWICFDTEDDDFEGSRNWVAPCKCHGSTQWVHQSCVQRWIDEKRTENDYVEAHCPLCLTKYKISFDELNLFVIILNKLDDQAGLLCPYFSAGIVIAAAYWGAVSYGAITVMQVMGEQEALEVMEGSNPYLLLLLLPSIPLGLITSKMIDWEKPFLSLMQRFTSKLPLLKIIVPSFLYEPMNRPPNNVQIYPVNNPTITFSSALFFPSFATLIGKLLFRNRSYSNIHKTLLGGLLYIAVRSVMRIYQRQHNAEQWKSRKVRNLSEDNQ